MVIGLVISTLCFGMGRLWSHRLVSLRRFVCRATGWRTFIGSDPGLATNPTPEESAQPAEAHRLDLLFGINVYVPKGPLKGSRLMVEGGIPVYQDLDGPQLGTAWILSVGCSYAF